MFCDMNDNNSQWELCKENIQPLKQGRSIVALTSAMQPQQQQDNLLKEQHAYEEAIRFYDGSDPLDVWYKYMKWTEQYFPSGKSNQVRRLAEKCIKALKDNTRYRNDLRWLEMFMKVAQNSSNLGSTEVYQNMRKCNQCTKLSRFYIQWASEVEASGDFKRAAEIFNDGLSNEAEPRKELDEGLKEFEFRVARKFAESPLDKEEPDVEPTRNLFGILRPVGGKAEAPFIRQSVPHPTSQSFGLKSATTLAPPAAKFSVFDENKPSAVLPAASQTCQLPAQRSLLVAEGVQQVNKENSAVPGQWSSNKIDLKRAPVCSTVSQPSLAPAFSVYVDVNDNKSTKQSGIQTVTIGSTALNAKKFDDGQQDALILPAKKAMKTADSGSTQQNSNERRMYCFDKVYGGLEEMSFEELRAIKMMESRKQTLQITQKAVAIDNKVSQPTVGKTSTQETLARLQSSLKTIETNIKQSSNADSNSGASTTTSVPSQTAPSAFTAVERGMNTTSAVRSVRTPFAPKSDSGQLDAAQLTHASLQPRMEWEGASQFAVAAKPGVDGEKRQEAFAKLNSGTSQPINAKCLAFESIPSSGEENLSAEGRLSSPNGTLTTNVYKEAMACFSNTLHFSQVAEDDKTEASFPDANSLCKTSTQPKFTVFDECAAAAEKPGQTKPNFNEDNKENIKPPGYSEPQQRRKLSGYLTPAVDFVVVESPFVLEDHPDSASALSKAVPSSSTQPTQAPVPQFAFPDFVAANANTFDVSRCEYEPTIARFLAPNADPNNRAVSTPLHHGVALPPPCFYSSLRPGEVFRAGAPESNADASVCKAEMPPKKDNNNDFTRSTADPKPFDEAQTTEAEQERRLSTIAETSREYRSASSSSSSEASSRRHFSAGMTSSSAHSVRLQIINEHPSWQTPGCNAGTPSSHHFSSEWSGAFRSANAKAGDSVAAAAYSNNTPFHVSNGQISDRVVPTDAASKAVRRLSLGNDEDCNHAQYSVNRSVDIDENLERTGFGFKSFITSKVDPFSQELQSQILLKACGNRRLETFTNFHHFATCLPRIRVGQKVELGGESFLVEKLLGEGAFARAYCCRLILDDESSGLELNSSNRIAMKVQKPACPWEFYICEEVRRRLKSSNAGSADVFMTIKDAYLYSDGSVMLNDFSPHGTLLALVNKYKAIGETMDEMLVVYFTIEILRLVELLHDIQIIHADIKPDNILLMNLPKSCTGLSACANKLSFWFGQESSRCLKLIDFGRGIDMKQFAPDMSFKGKADTSCFQCPEMLDGRPWNYQADNFGVLATVHVLLFGEYVKIYETQGKWKCSASFKRRWNVPLWKSFFESLLNVPDCNHQPNLSQMRSQFEEYFVDTINANEWNPFLKQMHSFYAS